jgi:TetR/AcrR family transcriptional regulator, tetracycline repressor protein
MPQTLLPLLNAMSSRDTEEVTETHPGDSRRDTEYRRGVGRPPIPAGRIIESALTIVDEEGAAALSMRTLAERLGSSTATLYRHFPNRSALVIDVIDRVLGEVDLDIADLDTTSWRQACQRLAHSTFDALSRHCNVAPLLAEHPPIGPNAMKLREHWFAVMLHHGFPPQPAAHSTVMLARYVLGFATQLVAPPATTAQIFAALRGADMASFPATATVAHLLPVRLEDSFALGLEMILDGLSELREPEGP